MAKIDFKLLSELSGKLEEVIAEIEAVVGVFDNDGECLDKFAWNLLQAWGEFEECVINASDAQELMKDS